MRLPRIQSRATIQTTFGMAFILSLACPANLYAEQSPDKDWILTGLFSHSNLSGGRDSWNTEELELLYRADNKLILGGRLDVRGREQGTDTLYTALFSYQASPALEWHGSLRLAPGADFSPRQTYRTGIEWRSNPKVSLLFDVERLNFPEGSIDQYTPGLTYWFNERTFLTTRYTRGRAFGSTNYDSASLRLTLGLDQGHKLVLGVAHGTDPEKDPAVPGVILTSANTYGIYYHWPLNPSLELILGAEHEDRRDIYRRTTATIGFVRRF